MQKKQVATVEEVGTRLEEWRQSRRCKRTAIPEDLWSAAIEVAREMAWVAPRLHCVWITASSNGS